MANWLQFLQPPGKPEKQSMIPSSIYCEIKSFLFLIKQGPYNPALDYSNH